MTETDASHPVTLHDLRYCFEGAIPAVIATASAGGTPNVTYLSRVQYVDADRVALSNQFFSKTVRNLAENQRASILLIDPTTYQEYRLALVFERTERRGPIFERLREDIAVLAALEAMEGVFHLRAADIYRVVSIDRLPGAGGPNEPLVARPSEYALRGAGASVALGTLVARLARCPDLDALLTTTVDGLADLLGYEHSLLLLLDEEGRRLYTIASHGYDAEGVGSEVALGEGLIGLTAERCEPLRIGNLRQMTKYSRTVRRSFESSGDIEPGRSLPVPGLPDAQSRVGVPALAMGQLVGVLVVEARHPVAFDETDEVTLGVIATLVASAVDAARAEGQTVDATSTAPSSRGPTEPAGPPVVLRFFPADGSAFLDGEYLIKGVAGRILQSLVSQLQADGRTHFTNREVRLDPSLDLPPFRDNFESRLILLKRRLDERAAPIRIEKTGRGRFRLVVDAPLHCQIGSG